jgi:hypothetical protein
MAVKTPLFRKASARRWWKSLSTISDNIYLSKNRQAWLIIDKRAGWEVGIQSGESSGGEFTSSPRYFYIE